jgi:hypothetical protein
MQGQTHQRLAPNEAILQSASPQRLTSILIETPSLTQSKAKTSTAQSRTNFPPAIPNL